MASILCWPELTTDCGKFIYFVIMFSIIIYKHDYIFMKFICLNKMTKFWIKSWTWRDQKNVKFELNLFFSIFSSIYLILCKRPRRAHIILCFLYYSRVKCGNIMQITNELLFDETHYIRTFYLFICCSLILKLFKIIEK